MKGIENVGTPKKRDGMVVRSSDHSVRSPLKFGIIGYGGAGHAHWSYISCIDECTVSKVYDLSPEARARACATGAGFEVCDNLDQFWEGLDAVSVCTPDSTHVGYMVEALNRGIHVICEKPLTDSVEGILQVKVAEQQSRAVAALVHQMRFVPLHRVMKELVVSGELGAVSYLEGYYVHDLRSRAFVHDTWRRDDNATPLVYSGCHFVDLLRWFAGEEIIEVYAAANNIAFPGYPGSDLNVVTLRFASGVIGKVVVAFGAAGPQDHSTRIYGTEASVDNNVLFKRDGSWGRRLHEPILIQRKLLKDPNGSNYHGFYRQLRANVPAWLLSRAYDVLRYLSRRPNTEYGARQYPLRLYEHALACVEAFDDFVTAVRTGGTPLCTVDEAAATVLACLAGVESYTTNKPVTVSSLAGVVRGA